MNLRLCFITTLLLFPESTVAADSVVLTGKGFDQPQFLPVDEAFLLTVSKVGDGVQLHWLVQPGYYLYRDRLSFSGPVGMPELPDGKRKFDEIFGEVEVYYDELEVFLQFSGSSRQDSDKILVGYQGCADAGLCYPPQKREFILEIL